MAAETAGWGSKLFPEIRICFGTKEPLVLPPWMQAVLLSAVLVGAAALCYLGISRSGYKRLAADQQAAVARAETANADLQDDIAGLQNKLTDLGTDRDQAESRVAALGNQAGTLRGLLETSEAKLHALEETRDRLSQQRGEIEQQAAATAAAEGAKTGHIDELSRALDQTRQALHAAQAESAGLTARLSRNEADRAAEEARFAQYKTSLEQTAKELEKLGAARVKGTIGRTRLRVKLGEIWQKLSQVPLPQPAAEAAAAVPAAGGVAPVAGLGRAQIGAVVRVLASTGVDVARMFSHFGGPRLAGGEGGPFTPPPKGSPPPDPIDPEKLAAIQGMALVLPLTAPLVRYEVGSPFGPRIDPFNRRPSFHTGIDMDAPYLSPVCATAPGTVVYAGYLGDYGKVVEIDHGFGIVTLYAHLHRYFVAVGQEVAAHAEIGLVGTTGRSSGPHVHYEVRVNGQPQDPNKFIGLARLIPAAARQLTPAAAERGADSR